MNVVGDGSIDNIRMTKAAEFTYLTITAANKTNGAVTDYQVTFKPTVSLVDGDMFNLKFPDEVGAPLEPECLADTCLGSIQCTSETGRIVA